MSLLLRVKALAEAVGADIKSIKTDSRLTDSREWSEETVTQEEAEAGTASTRRAWTSQRVRQAINAWWQLVTSGFGRNFIAASNEQAARNVLQLGTAATRNVGTAAGNLLEANSNYFGLQSHSDFPNGTLIRTSFPSAISGPSITLKLWGKGYGGLPHLIMVEAYQYDGGWTSVGGINLSGSITNVTIMEVDGYVCFWFASTGYWNSFFVEAYNTTQNQGSSESRVTSVENSNKPSGTKVLDIPLTKTYNTSNLLDIGGTAATARSALGLGTSATANIDWLLAQNVNSATHLSGNEGNWAGLRSSSVANMLGWNNYGNGHVIFDASSGTSPTGVAVDSVNAQINWSASFPTLMGWNGNSTYGVRVDNARSADTVDGIPPHYARNNLANRLVRTNANGYLDTGYINIDIEIEDSQSVAEIYIGNGTDQYLRKVSKAHFKAQLGIQEGEWVDLRPYLKSGYYFDSARNGRNSHPRIRKLSCGRVELDGIISFNATSGPIQPGIFVNVPAEFRPTLTVGGLMFGDTASPLSFGACNWIVIGQVEYSPPAVHGDISAIPLTLASPAQDGALCLNGIYWFT